MEMDSQVKATNDLQEDTNRHNEQNPVEVIKGQVNTAFRSDFTKYVSYMGKSLIGYSPLEESDIEMKIVENYRKYKEPHLKDSSILIHKVGENINRWK